MKTSKNTSSSQKTSLIPSQSPKVSLETTSRGTAPSVPKRRRPLTKPMKPRKGRQTPQRSSKDKALALADPATQYMAEIRKYPLLSKEQEQEIALQYKETGDPKLAEVLVTSNLRFVVKVAMEYSKFGAQLIDLIQEGNVGLMHAVKEFNPHKGVRLISYAAWWIRGYIQEYLMKQYSLVKMGTTQNQRKLFYQLQKHHRELERMNEKQSMALLSGKLGVSEKEIQDMKMRMSGRDLSLDAPINSQKETGATFLSQREREDGINVVERISHLEDLSQLSKHLEALKLELNERESFLLSHRLLSDSPMTLQAVGEKYGITREAVRQMESKLIKKLRSKMKP